MRTVKVSDVLAYLEGQAPPEMKEDFDNVGLLVGVEDREVSRVLVALDITDEVISQAGKIGAQLIVSHHPLFFSCKAVRYSDAAGRKIFRLIEGGMAAICMHTNLDSSFWGVNAELARVVGLSDVSVLEEHGRDSQGRAYGVGRVGVLAEPMDMADFLEKIKTGLNSNGLRYHDSGRKIRRVAVLGGSGGDYLGRAAADNCDVFVTSDIKYNVFLEAKEMGISLIDGDHFATENVICPVLKEKLTDKFPTLEVSVSTVHEQTSKFF